MTETSTTVMPDATGSHRDRLLAAMADALRERGFRGTTVADVVRHARVSRRTFYEHFEDLVACYLALGDVLGDLVLAQIRAAASLDKPLEERLDAATDAYLRSLTSEPELTRTYGYEMYLAGERGIERLHAVHEKAAQVLHDLVEEAREREPDLQALPVDTAIVIVAGIRELATRVFDAPDPARRRREVQDVARGLLRAVLTAPADG
ncbi:TetR/AcrR family transcriptional regulator [Conexibacter sp. SYSU D00693]|uniref:TetR/AcrR family transcriptional regulator n=1 Tax=Conexibacter sp. SYSU D00693 TaxID=2812560 RepID=UPI00196ACA87|nr:TetR/AcrR family transcriptional regulator [Conexibacter sp. SYSU D00693]